MGMVWTLTKIEDDQWYLKSDGIPYEDEYLTKIYKEYYGEAPTPRNPISRTKDYYANDYRMKSREIIGFTEEDIAKAVDRGWTVLYPEDPVGSAYLNGLTTEQRSKYMGYITTYNNYKKTLYYKMQQYDELWKVQLKQPRTDRNIKPGEFWYWDSNKSKWEPNWGAYLDERSNIIDDDIAKWRKLNPEPDFRPAYDKVGSDIKRYTKTQINKLIPDVDNFMPKISGGVSMGFAGVNYLSFLIELAVFTMFIYEEALQVACRSLTETMWPNLSDSSMMAVYGTDYMIAFKSAISTYLNCWWLLVYCQTGYEAYFNAASLLGDCARFLMDKEPLGIYI